MWVTAIKEHSYRGKRIPAGRDYEINSPTDFKVLQVAGLVRPKKTEVKPYLPATNREQAKNVFEKTKAEVTKNFSGLDLANKEEPMRNVPVRDMQAVANSQFETREETPEESDDDEIDYEVGTTSPPENGPKSRKSRKEKRQYNRKDMNPK